MLASTVLFVAVGRPARADERAEELAAARRLKLAGIGVSVSAFGLSLLGASLFLAADIYPDSCVIGIAAEEGPCGPSPTPMESVNNQRVSALFVSGIVISLSSDLLMAIGLPMWVGGARRERALRRQTSRSDALFRF